MNENEHELEKKSSSKDPRTETMYHGAFSAGSNCCQGPKLVGWLPSDTIERYEDNCKKPERLELLKANGWYPLVPIDYNLNSFGFRSPEFPVEPHRESFIALGCSNTIGIGIHEKDTWPAQLAEQLDLPYYNLGQGGTGIEAAFRVLSEWLPIIQSKVVYIYENPGRRREIYNPRDAEQKAKESPHGGFVPSSWQSITAHMPAFLNPEAWNAVLEDDDYAMARKRAIYGLVGLCSLYDTKLVMVTAEEVSIRITESKVPPLPRARDLVHPGRKHFTVVARMLKEKRNDTNPLRYSDNAPQEPTDSDLTPSEILRGNRSKEAGTIRDDGSKQSGESTNMIDGIVENRT